MPKYALPSLVAVAFLPLMFVVWLFTAARVPAMDGMVMAMPRGVATAVAGLVMSEANSEVSDRPIVDRALRLDPENSQAWTWRCNHNRPNENPKDVLADCEHAIRVAYQETNFNGKARAQERLGDFCAAEDSFTMANRFVNAGDAEILRGMGRTALRCGHTAASVASFEVAEETDLKQLDDDDTEDLTLDYDWLVIANNANRNPKGAAEACAKGHKGWRACDCSVAQGKFADGSAAPETATCRESK